METEVLHTPDINSGKSCCFTGHRLIYNKHISLIRANLPRVIESVYDRGIREFLLGGAIGFDTEAAIAVLNFIETHDDAELVMVLPCPEQDKYWNDAQKLVYRDIIGCADKVIYVSEHYTKMCMLNRNRYMVDNSSIVISYLMKNFGGSAYTVKYASKQNKEIIDITNPDEKQMSF